MMTGPFARGLLSGLLILAVSVLTACGSSQEEPGSPTPEAEDAAGDPSGSGTGAEQAEGRSILDGVYTSSQASRGEQQFQQECSFCHSTAEFRRIFSGPYANSTLDNLYGLIATTMPQTSPGSLAPDTYAAIVGYFLELNGYPAGDEELPPDPAVLSQIRIEAQ